MIRGIAGHPTAANLLMLLLISVGLLTLADLKRETFPRIAPRLIDVSVVYAGATPEDVEDAICRRLEDAIDGIEDVEEVRSEALDSVAKVTVEVQEGADVDAVLEDIKTEVEALDDLPPEAEDPVIRPLGRTDKVVSVAVVGGMPLAHLKALCEDLKDQLLREDTVEIVHVLGFSDHQIRVEVAADVLLQYSLSPTDLAAAIGRQSLDLPGGTLQSPDGDVVIRFSDERRNPSEFEDLVVVAGATGAELRLGQIATITDVFEKDEEKFLFNGRRAGLLDVLKTSDQDSLDVVEAVQHFIDRQNQLLPPSTELVLTQNLTSITRDRLDMLVRNGWQGLTLVFLVLWAFFNLRLSFWVIMGLPVSFLGAFFVMTWIGYSINMLTMVALLLALGLLMDDGIVLAENIATHLARGKRALDAAVDGTLEVLPGVLSSFATTIVVFAPLAFLSGDLGAILKVIPVVLILVMAVSMIEALLILPSHLAHSLQHVDPHKTSRFRAWLDGVIETVRERVLGRLVDRAVRARHFTLGLAVLLLLLSVAALAGGLLKFQAFPAIDGDVVVARVLLPQGTPLSRTEQIVERITEAWSRVDEEFRPRQPDGQDLTQAVSVQHNFNADAFETGPHVATLTVDLLSAEVRDAPLDDVLIRWREETGSTPDVVSLQFAEPSFGPAGRALEIRLAGDDLTDLKQASLEVQDWFRGYRGVFDVFDDLRPGKPQLELRMKEGSASLGASSQLVAGQLRAAFLGATVQEVQVGAENYEVDLRLVGADRDSEADLEDFHVTLGTTAVPLLTIAELERTRGHARIARIDGVRVVTVYGSVDSRQANVSELVTRFLAEEAPRLQQQHPGIRISVEGEIKNGAQTQASMLRGFLIGLIGVFVLLSLQFRSYREPLVVMMAIPMCLVGVIAGHLLMGLDMTLPSMLGFVSLAGVVVNDSILLVSFIRMRRAEGLDLIEAACQASRLRFRAVLLTSVTTIAGMAPLLLETSLQAQVLIPLATSVVFGLAASTLLVLLVVPGAYVMVAKRDG